MLIEFHVKNYRSIKDECIFSMEAYDRDKKHIETIRSQNDLKFLPLAAIFGPNASGKTTLISSLKFLKRLVKVSGNFSSDSGIEDRGFAFTSEKSPTEISIEFLNGSRYYYSISTFDGKIYSEMLLCDNKLIFNRVENNIQFGDLAQKEINKLEFVKSITNPNSSFLSKCSQSNIEIIKNAYEWISEKIIFVAKNKSNMNRLSEDIKRRKSEIIHMLSIADLGISDIASQDIEIPAEIRTEISEEIFKKLKFNNLKRYSMGHDLISDNEKKTYYLDMELESNGTVSMVALAPEWLYALETGSLLVVDEIESSLHPLLVDHLLNLISDPVTNPKGAQIIFTTHDALIPKRNELRRDQIWFTARNPNVGKTVLYSLLDYDVRPDLEFTNNYLKGRFGAIPMIKNRRKSNGKNKTS